MSVAQTCKHCPKFVKERGWCTRNGKHTSAWQDWCEPRREDWENWRLNNG